MRFIIILAVGLAVFGCSDDSAGSDSEGARRDSALPTAQDAGLRIVDRGVTPPPPTPIDAEVVEEDAFVEQRLLQIIGPDEVTVEGGGEATITVRYLDGFDAPAEGEISAGLMHDGRILGVEGIEGTAIVAPSEIASDAAGEARFTLQAGLTPLDVIVIIGAPLAESVHVTVHVEPPPVGLVNLRARYADGRYAPEGLGEVQAFLAEGTCDELGRLRGAPRIIAPFDGDEVVQIEAEHEAELIAMAYALTNGRIIATGCTPGLIIQSGVEQDVEVHLLDHPLEFKGLFEVEHRLDFTDLMDADEDLDGLSGVLDIFGALGGTYGAGAYPRGDGIIRLVCERIGVDAADCEVLRLFGAQIVDELVGEVLSEDALEVLDVLGDVHALMADFTVYGEMVFANTLPDEEGLLPNNESRWHGLEFYWTNNCPHDTREACTRRFDLLEVGVGQRSIVAEFDAHLEEDGAHLRVAPHVLEMHIGRIISSLIERWLLPAILGVEGPISYESFISDSIDCAGINEALPPFDPASGLCERSIVTPLAELLRERIASIGGAPRLLSFEGRVRVADADVDLQVDRLEEGVWDMSFGDDETLITEAGTFEGCRVGTCEEAPPAP